MPREEGRHVERVVPNSERFRDERRENPLRRDGCQLPRATEISSILGDLPSRRKGIRGSDRSPMLSFRRSPSASFEENVPSRTGRAFGRSLRFLVLVALLPAFVNAKLGPRNRSRFPEDSSPSHRGLVRGNVSAERRSSFDDESLLSFSKPKRDPDADRKGLSRHAPPGTPERRTNSGRSGIGNPLPRETALDRGHGGLNEKRLLHYLLDHYNVLERPVANESDPLVLSFGLTLMQIIDVGAEESTTRKVRGKKERLRASIRTKERAEAKNSCKDYALAS
ncbi:unnamed protein product [Darwinula stevensoni]|uniref:Neurotransmitter-gated ion-channel ligand-binding domain-containing protein n=1 Tax=Darwinula stevensoni TaxID=69355 RepID=A0A7R9AC62_9CRUS|nr:unnamed protein product [Darwinula stevensoni]CAG0900090.1 unnamed protein product [Darwinula stevensoni]